MTAEIAAGEADARAALAGNPSDGYGGAVLAVTLPAYTARAEIRSAERLQVDPDSDLVRAAVRRFARLFAPEAPAAAITWSTTIPRGVGLGGSSAIVIAVLRALQRAPWGRPLTRRPWPSWRWPSRSRNWASPPACRTGWPSPTAASRSWTLIPAQAATSASTPGCSRRWCAAGDVTPAA